MALETYSPGSPVSTLVETFWAMSDSGGSASRRLVCPHGTMELVINLADRNLSFFDERSAQCVRVPLLAGAYSKSFLIDPAEYTRVLGVRFKAGRAGLFFRVPAHELQNTDVALEDLYPGEGERLLDQLLSARGLREQFQILEVYLARRLPRATPLHPGIEHAIDEFMHRPGARAISAVQAEVGLSHTRFIQLFRESVGLTPNVFCRIQRFRSVLRQIETGRPVRWADVAADCGYFDQAHLIRDFRAFSGLTPGAYLSEAGRPRTEAA